MEKTEQLDKVKFELSRLSLTQQNEFSRLGNKILSVNFLSRDREKDRKDYFLFIEWFAIFRAYFSVLDFDLVKDDFNGVVGLRSSHQNNHLRLSKNETLVLLIFRQMYFRKQKEVSVIDQITTSYLEIHESLNATGILDKPVAKTEFFTIIRTMKRFGVCDVIGEKDSENSILILYPSILHILSFETLAELELKLNSYIGGEQNETIDED